MRDGQCSLFSSFSPWSVLSFLFFSSYFAKLAPLFVHVEIRQNAYIFFISNISLRRPSPTFFSDDIRVLLLFSSSPFCRCFLVLSSSGLDVLHLGCVWAVILEDCSFSFYAMQSPFFSFPGVCDKHNVPQIMVVLACLFARKPMARAGCKYPLPASRKSIPNTDTFPARPYIRTILTSLFWQSF